MSTYVIYQNGKNFMARLGAPTIFRPTIESDSPPTLEQCRVAVENFVRPLPSEEIAEMKKRKKENMKISAWQAKAALALIPHPEAGTMLAAAEAAIEAMPDGEEKIVVKAAWENNANFQRSSPTIQAFAAQLGLSSTDLDHLFEKAISLSV